MTTEEKAKAYDEDERMRKIISDILLTDSDEIREILDANNVLMQDIDTWLEKQGEKNLATDFSDLRTWKYIVDAVWTEKEGMGQYIDSPFTEEIAKKLQKRFGNIEQKSVEKVEPKFHEGEWVVNRFGDAWHIDSFDGKNYQASNFVIKYKHCYFPIEKQNEMHLWTVEDARAGDVLVDEDNNIGIHKEIEGLYWNSYIYLGCDGKLRGFSIGGSHKQANTRPATKEQRDTLMEAMADAGYTFDFEKKELKKVEPKFHKGEWIVLEKKPCQIISIDDKGNYIVQYCDDEKTHELSKKFCESYFHLWTIQDAKDGDILSTEKGRPFIFRGLTDKDNPDSPVAYCGIDSIDDFYDCSKYNDSGWTYEKVFPATIEQHGLLFQKMKEAGYEWDAEKKELKKIEQKSAWSEEDEKMIWAIPLIIKSYPNQEMFYGYSKEKLISWFKSLKDRVQPKQEWVEEDKKMINKICQNLYDYPRIKSPFDDESFNEAQKEVQFIKSLRPQNNITDEELAQAKKDAYNDALDKIEYHSGEPTFDDGWHAAIDCILKNSIIPHTTWKPTEAQLTQLGAAVSKGRAGYFNNDVLRELYEQLKQL